MSPDYINIIDVLAAEFKAGNSQSAQVLRPDLELNVADPETIRLIGQDVAPEKIQEYARIALNLAQIRNLPDVVAYFTDEGKIAYRTFSYPENKIGFCSKLELHLNNWLEKLQRDFYLSTSNNQSNIPNSALIAFLKGQTPFPDTDIRLGSVDLKHLNELTGNDSKSVIHNRFRLFAHSVAVMGFTPYPYYPLFT